MKLGHLAPALRLNEQLRQSVSQPAGESERPFEIIRGGRDGDRQRAIGGR